MMLVEPGTQQNILNSRGLPRESGKSLVRKLHISNAGYLDERTQCLCGSKVADRGGDF